MSKRGFLFNSVPAPKLKRSGFDLSHEFKFSCGLGKLVPVACFEAVPGDTFRITPSVLARMQATISPMMHRLDASVHWFKIPYRLIWEDFEDFMTGGKDGTSAPLPPYYTVSQIYEELFPGELSNYLGIPLPYKLDVDGKWKRISKSSASDQFLNTKICSLPFRAYQKVYYDWFVDQNVTDIPDLHMESGQEPNLSTDFYNPLELHRRGWKKDYFTSALTDPQRGQTVTIGLSGSAPVTVEGGVPVTIEDPIFNNEIGMFQGYQAQFNAGSNVKLKEYAGGDINGISGTLLGELTGTADLNEASAITISALRTAFKLQQFLERNNIAGARYIEQILAHFGVKSSDSRLQRSEYLGSGRVPVVISEVETNADGNGQYDYNVGDLAGKSKAVGGLGRVTAFCEEHCFIMGIMSIMPKASYQQGLPKMFSRFDKFDYFWPEFQNIGEQAILNKEIYFSPEDDQNEEEFGYQSRYSEYKYMPDRVAGDLSTNLSWWHMGRIFNSRPVLNQSFIDCTPSDRVFAVNDNYSEDSRVVCDMWFKIDSIRPMSIFSTPKLN